ncbi:MAG: hypothetical protein F2840_00590 [Actinobacteria bacterium]|uniref:Unannotated protein n=1 Tax=freshwater metagenome TaxID=449393 RepID=A0A6J7ICQ1_9ZZZZ|nr:hypothetical protein [Actinomycetota bacterium]
MGKNLRMSRSGIFTFTAVALAAILAVQPAPAHAASSDASLDLLAISAGTLTPAFDSGTLNYTAVVTNTTPSVTLTPTAAPGATVTVNGAAVVSGAASAPVALTVGTNTLTTVVTAGNGVTQRTYTVTVQRSTPADRDLAALKLSAGQVSPAFDKAIDAYTAEVAFTTERITITPTVSAESSTVKVNGQAVTSGGTSDAVVLAVGDNDISIVVKAQDLSLKRYALTVRRASEVELIGLRVSDGTLSPAFSPAVSDYTATALDSTAAVTVTATVAASSSSVRVNGTEVAAGAASGAIPLAFGPTTITVLVTATDKRTKAYSVVVTRPQGAAPATNGTHLGGGVWLVRSGEYTRLKVMLASAASTPRLGAKQTARAPLNRLVTARVRSLTPRTSYRVLVKINGRWVAAGSVRSGRKGIASVPALRFENNGRFRIKLVARDKIKHYVRIIARAG